MPPGTKRSELERWIAERRPERIGEAEYAAIRAALAPVSESYLRKLLRESGVPLDPLIEGVRQGSFDELHQSLDRLRGIYEAGDAARRRAVRAIVITAKDHARLVARSKSASPEKRAEKEEMILWLLTWLENPPLFADWVRLRRARWEAEAGENGN
ncbi:MAG TPA: hypothetical protein VGR73_00135 [Bryobacteraceae bacterium]|nr:hypothetical protein [Bryobacteraceae bacterium]